MIDYKKNTSKKQKSLVDIQIEKDKLAKKELKIKNKNIIKRMKEGPKLPSYLSKPKEKLNNDSIESDREKDNYNPINVKITPKLISKEMRLNRFKSSSILTSETGIESFINKDKLKQSLNQLKNKESKIEDQDLDN